MEDTAIEFADLDALGEDLTYGFANVVLEFIVGCGLCIAFT